MEKLYENKHPDNNSFDLCANYILEYQEKNNKIENNIYGYKRNSISEIIISLSITPFEFLCPFKLIKGNYITIRIKGNWIIEKNKNEIYDNYPVGILLGRNSSCSEEGYFQISNGMKYIPKKNGCLFIKFNYNPYSNPKISGKCSIIVSYVNLIDPIFPLYKFLGFEDEITNISLITYLNFMRKSPKVFANNFLAHLKKKQIYKELINELYNFKPCENLIYNQFLNELSEIHCKELVKYNKFSLYDINERSIRMKAMDYYDYKNLYTRKINKNKESFYDIKHCLGFVINPINKEENSFYLFFLINLLLDELVPSKRNRKILLNPNLKYYGCCIAQHKLFGNVCSIIFTEKDYITKTDKKNNFENQS